MSEDGVVFKGRDFLVHEDPEATFQRQLKTLSNIRKRFGEVEYWSTVRELILKDLWFLLRFALDYKFLDDNLHGRIMLGHYAKSISGNRGNPADLLTLVPRSHGKSTLVSGFIVQEVLNDQDISIAIVSGTEKLARFMAKLIADTLLFNPVLQRCFPDILPNANNLTTKWGLQGYFLPHRKPRIDPTLAFGSATANITGTHPDILIFDDLVFSRKSKDLEMAENAFVEAMGLLTASSRVLINGTRWDDGDLYGKILTGQYTGNLGGYHTLLMGCWEQGSETPIYPKKIRCGMEKESGFSREDLLRKKHNNPEFFSCQFLNDPAPESEQEIRVSDLKTWELPDEVPIYLRSNGVGVETVGPSLTFPSVFRKSCEEFGSSIYIQEIKTPRSRSEEVTKQLRILSALAPITSQGKLIVPKWAMTDKDGLVDEIRRFKAARWDDCLDALHFVPVHMNCGVYPDAKALAQLYISADLAFSTGQDSDWTVFMAVVIDFRGNHWVLDYKRFRESNPMKIANELIKFYQKQNAKSVDPSYNKKKRPSLGRSYQL